MRRKIGGLGIPRLVSILWFVTCSLAPVAFGGEWRAGAAATVITPEQPMWMSGYGSRNHPAEGKLHDLWCKALALESPGGQRVVLISLDLCGISKSVSDTICQNIGKQLGLGRESIMIACSHTHTGPMIENNLETMFDFSPEEKAKITQYSRGLEQKVVATVATAMERVEPARLAWANGTCTFAVNRRNNAEAKVPELRERGELKGPVDYDVPVLCVRNPDGKVRAIVCGYACHCTVLSFYQWSGDYAGFAQIELEKMYPDAVALFFAGCGGDQNPLPRREVELAATYGKRLANAVDQVVQSTMNTISDYCTARLEYIPLPFDHVPSTEELSEQLEKGDAYVKRRARNLMAELSRKGKLSPDYPYPVQVWRLGDLCWISLGGEVVVDYSVRLKRELGRGPTWVTAYANDVMAYIPSLRVLDEGGYEGGGAMVYYGLPTKWGPAVEELIVSKVHDLVRATEKQPSRSAK